jgi:hypothetical protein
MEEEIKLKSGKFLQIFVDDSPENPRDWDNWSIMALTHKNYTLGDSDIPFNFKDFDSFKAVGQYIKKTYNPLVIFPVSMYDHSNVVLSLVNASGFDTSNVGFAYITQERLDILGSSQGYGDGILDDETDEEYKLRLQRYIEKELEVYNNYLSGEVYRFKLIEKKRCDLHYSHDIEHDSLRGFYGSDYTTNGILDNLSEEDQPYI